MSRSSRITAILATVAGAAFAAYVFRSFSGSAGIPQRFRSRGGI